MGRFRQAHETGRRIPKGETIVLVLAAPALVLSIGLGAACGGAGAKGLGDVTSEGGTDTTGALSAPSDGGTGGSATGSFAGSGDAKTCDPAAADQAGCACKPGTRKCYSGSFATRGVGACHDGTQTCSSGELPVWGPCMQQVLPVSCGSGPCDERAACLPHDAGTPTPMDSGIPPHCHLVQGYNGNGTFPDGSLYCEGNGGGGGFGGNPFGGDGGGLFGPFVPGH